MHAADSGVQRRAVVVWGLGSEGALGDECPSRPRRVVGVVHVQPAGRRPVDEQRDAQRQAGTRGEQGEPRRERQGAAGKRSRRIIA